jgi:TM2 domain-containing membrane protein YozV
MIGPASKSYFLIFILSCICAGLQYFYIGQTGKGLVFTLVTLFVMCPLVFITCGIGAFIAAPYGLFLLIESFVIASKMKTQAVGPWRFF